MTIYFVRHGVTYDNIAGVFQGPDSELTPEGEVQAGKVAERLSAITINEIWSSPMIRAYKTAEFINQYQKTKLNKVDELREIKRPTFAIGKTHEDPRVKASGYTGIELITDPHFSVEDGESFADLVARAQVVITKLENLAAQKPADYTVAVASHGLMLATLLLCIIHRNQATPELLLEPIKRISMENTGISIARFKQGKWKLLTMGDFAHL